MFESKYKSANEKIFVSEYDRHILIEKLLHKKTYQNKSFLYVKRGAKFAAACLVLFCIMGFITGNMGFIYDGLTDKKSSENMGERNPSQNTDNLVNEETETSMKFLTAGEWNDNNNWTEFTGLLKSNPPVYSIYPSRRIEVTVLQDGKPVNGVLVTGRGGDGQLIYTAVSNNKGIAYLFESLFTKEKEQSIKTVEASYKNIRETAEVTGGKAIINLNGGGESLSKSLDLLIMCDTTGSMGDELDFLKRDISDIIGRVKNDNGNIPVRLSVNFYRDIGDDYVVRDYPFTEDVASVKAYLEEQSAGGGGDYEEAVHTALENAIYGHEWNNDAYAKILLLVLDAPPHRDEEVIRSLQNTLISAAEKGICIIPVASSGINKDTEVFLRSLSVATNGTYVFLTDDSGIGNDHIEPDVGGYNLELLSDCIVRIINGYLK